MIETRPDSEKTVERDWSAVDTALLDPAVHGRGEHHVAFGLLREHDPVHWTVDHKFGKSYWAVTRYEDVERLLLDHRMFSNSWNTRVPRTPHRMSPETRHELLLDAMVSFLDNPAHGLYRRPINKHFSVPVINRLTGWVDELCEGIIDEVADRESCDLVDELAGEVPVRVVMKMFGVPEEDWSELREATGQFLAASDPRYIVDGDQAKTSRLGMQRLAEYMTRMARERRADPRDDLVSVIGALEVHGEPLSDHELAAWLFALISAGLETTRNAIAVGVWLLLEHPDQARQLLEDPGLAAPAAEEIMRWMTPSKNRLRIANENTEFGGRQIRAGDWVVGFQVAANRDPLVYDDPDAFDIHRDGPGHLSFGTGIHACLGRHLARLEMTTFIPKLLRTFPDLHRLDDGPLPWLVDASSTGFSSMPVGLGRPRLGTAGGDR